MPTQTIFAFPCGKQNIFYKLTPVLTYYHIWFTADKTVVVTNNQVGYTQQRKIIDFWRLNNDESINKKRNSYNANNKALFVFEAFLFDRTVTY
jgi:hypothetical protein